MAGYLVTGGVPEDQSVSVLFQSLFMNFYCILAILLVLVLALTQKDFGPMAKAEARAATTGELDDPIHKRRTPILLKQYLVSLQEPSTCFFR